MAGSGPVKLLSLDCGGVRGLSSLLILQNLMHRLSPLEEIRPCEVFNMIGGTSTGGIIAIMLGRLRMKVSDCIAAYYALSVEIFDEPWRPKAWKVSKALFGLTGSTDEARSERLRAVVCKVVEKNLPEDEKSYWTQRGGQFDVEKVPLKAASNDVFRDCLTFVVTAQKADGKRLLLRTYSHPTEVDYDFSIVEACLATSAAPLIFAPLSKDRNGMVEMFVDGGLGYNNPIYLVLSDARDIFPGRKIEPLVSVGTGVKQVSQVDNKLLPLAKKVAEMATDASHEAERFSAIILHTDKGLHNSYFRFDMSGEMSNIPFQEWRMLAVISQRTRAWLSTDDVRFKAGKCVDLLIPNRIKDQRDHQIHVQTASVEPASDQALPDLQVRLVHDQADWTNKIIVTDLVDGSELHITLWRTVRIPEDGKVYDLPAGLGRFPLVNAAQCQENKVEDSAQNLHCVIPMYDREAMYMEFIGGINGWGPGYIRRPYAIRPYVGGINAISGVPRQAEGSNESPSQAQCTGRTRVGELNLQSGESVGAPPLPEQDYIVADAATQTQGVQTQWLDGIAESTGRVKQFVAVPFGTGESIESQKTGKDNVGGLQLEIIPSLPLQHLRHHQGRQITVYAKLFMRSPQPFQVDAGALVWDYMYAVSLSMRLPMEHFYCIYLGVLLEPLYTLSHYRIQNESTIHVIVKLRGGGWLPTAKRMALGAGCAISQNISRDKQPSEIWDTTRAISVNIQIVNALAFEELTGLIAPSTPISFSTYQALNIPFFQYYIEDAQAVSGDFGGILSVGSFHSAWNTEADLEREEEGESWTITPDQCAKCHQRPPFRLLRPCSHCICQPCYRVIPAGMTIINQRSQLTSQCPVSGCDVRIERAVAWPSTHDRVPFEALYNEIRLPIRTDVEAGRRFRSVPNSKDTVK